MTDNTQWMLPEKAPEPQKWADAKPADPDKVKPSETHTGTDPLGRAVGPLEDHTVNKQVLDDEGHLVTPTATGSERKAKKRLTAAELRAAERAAAQGTT
jgi:hypothetical protein